MDFLGDIFNGLIKFGLFMTFGLPVLIGIIFLLIQSLAPDGFLSFYGRINRKKYIIFSILAFVLLIISIFILVFSIEKNWVIFAILGGTLCIASIIFYYSLMARRLHDFGQSAWWSLAIFILNLLMPKGNEVTDLIGIAIFIALSAIPGNKGENKYGLDPLAIVNNGEILS